MNTSNEKQNGSTMYAGGNGKTPRFSILHTSARPDKWRAVYDAWLAAADRPKDVEYVLVIDERWGFVPKGMKPQWDHWCVKFFPDRRHFDQVIFNTGRRCYVEGVNLAARHATGDILIVVADDQFPCEHWDTEISEFFKNGASESVQDRDRNWPVVEFVLWAPTGTPSEFERNIIVMPIMSRALYEQWGYVMYPGYESMYSDNDLCEHAKAEGVLIEARHLPVFPHRHPLFNDKGEWRKTHEVLEAGYDAAYKEQNRAEAYAIGSALLHARRAHGFRNVPEYGTTANPPTPIRKPAEPGRRRSICVCLPGETFSRPWVMAWTSLLAVLSQRFILFPPIFGYSSAPHVTRQGFWGEIMTGPLPDYVLWVDDDNILTPDGLMLLAADLEEHPEIDMAAGWSWAADALTITAGLFMPGKNGKHCGRIEHKTLMAGPHDLFRVEWTGFPAVLMRGSLLVDAGEKAFIPIPNNIKPWFCYGEDISFCLNVEGHLMVIDRRVRVPHLKLADNDLEARTKAEDLKTDISSSAELRGTQNEVEHAGIPA
jgi:hypothetical protein